MSLCVVRQQASRLAAGVDAAASAAVARAAARRGAPTRTCLDGGAANEWSAPHSHSLPPSLSREWSARVARAEAVPGRAWAAAGRHQSLRPQRIPGDRTSLSLSHGRRLTVSTTVKPGKSLFTDVFGAVSASMTRQDSDGGHELEAYSHGPGIQAIDRDGLAGPAAGQRSAAAERHSDSESSSGSDEETHRNRRRASNQDRPAASVRQHIRNPTAARRPPVSTSGNGVTSLTPSLSLSLSPPPPLSLSTSGNRAFPNFPGASAGFDWQGSDGQRRPTLCRVGRWREEEWMRMAAPWVVRRRHAVRAAPGRAWAASESQSPLPPATPRRPRPRGGARWPVQRGRHRGRIY